jgi:hypothetical protein
MIIQPPLAGPEDLSLPAPTTQVDLVAPPAGLPKVSSGDAVSVEVVATDSEEPPKDSNPFGEWFYRGAGHHSEFSWIVGSGRRMGIYTLPVTDDRIHILGRRKRLRFNFGFAAHFISGPVATDLPPRVYDIAIAFPYRGTWGNGWSYDVTVRPGWYTDFEYSASDAIRFPSHAILYRRVSEQWQWLLGIDYLDRDDIALLPVGGLLWTPTEDWRIEAVFPKPLVAHRWQGQRWFYITSEMGGGTWDIERVDGSEDMFTYRDFRLLFGLQTNTGDRDGCAEIGYVFERQLEYRSGTPDYRPPDSLVLRVMTRY